MNVLHKIAQTKRAIKSSITLLLILMIAACDKHVVYYTYQPISPMGWYSNDTLVFEFPITDSTNTLLLHTEVRHTAQYPFINLSLELSHGLKDSIPYQIDTLNYSLIDSDGKRGANNWSCLYETSQHPIHITSVQDSGIYQVKIRHIMQADSLTGIHDIGVKITRE